MNLATFEAFIKVMETQSISLAAEQLFITQPAVTKRIQNLEEFFGVKLFETIGRGIQPTHAAYELLPKIKLWLNDLKDIQNFITHQQTNIQGKLKIGTSHHIGLHHLPKYLRQYAQYHPLVNLDLCFVDSEQAHEQVLNGDLEFAFLTLPPQLDSRLHYHPLWQDELIFVVAPFHPLAQKQDLQLADLIQYPCLLPSNQTYTTQITLSAFQQQNLKLSQITMSNNPLESIRMLVTIGLGWSVLPKTLLNNELVQLHLQLQLKRQLGMVWHPKRSHSQAGEQLIQLMTQSY